MQLIKLSANKASFKTVNFNQTGLSIIVGKKENKKNLDIKKTYNSVGKSLIIRIIDFCLASNSIEEFEKKIPDWEFTLEFKIEDSHYIVSRKTSEQGDLILNSKQISITEFRDFFSKELFNLKEKNSISFRSLISRFIRPRKFSYNDCYSFVYKEQDDIKLLNNAYLLGLDTERVIKKIKLREEYTKTDNLKKSLKKDPTLKSFFKQETETEVSIVNLEQEIKKLQNDIDNFIIAEDYTSIKLEADNISEKLRSVRNKIFLLQNSINNINKSIEIKSDIPKEKILKIYDEINIKLPDILVKELTQLEEFNSKIIKNRIERLSSERKLLEVQLDENKKELKKLESLEDEKLQYLNKHGALEEYTAINQQLADNKLKLDKLKTYQNLLIEYKNRLDEIDIELKRENISTNNYLNKEAKSILDENINIFKSISNEFYENRIAGISISNNDGDNKLRYNINAHIDGDTGDGVSKVKIFCFDWTFLLVKHNHNLKFLFHDGRILDGMDSRQVSTLFKYAYKKSNETKLQYIISANEDSLESIREYFTEVDYINIIEKSKILELTDKSDESKLLGLQVDMDYER
jgi:uncharacterized protein YydD (DUF2326 family)